jgi:hypothetical protein
MDQFRDSTACSILKIQGEWRWEQGFIVGLSKTGAHLMIFEFGFAPKTAGTTEST